MSERETHRRAARTMDKVLKHHGMDKPEAFKDNDESRETDHDGIGGTAEVRISKKATKAMVPHGYGR